MEALDALTKAADTGTGNLLTLAVDAARKKATVGEISSALEKVYGRYEAKPTGVTGVYSSPLMIATPATPKLCAALKPLPNLKAARPKL